MKNVSKISRKCIARPSLAFASFARHAPAYTPYQTFQSVFLVGRLSELYLAPCAEKKQIFRDVVNVRNSTGMTLIGGIALSAVSE
jgi:hypothetical protein